jgi:hypothetical protein
MVIEGLFWLRVAAKPFSFLEPALDRLALNSIVMPAVRLPRASFNSLILSFSMILAKIPLTHSIESSMRNFYSAMRPEQVLA